MQTADEIIDEYCKQTNYIIGAGRSTLKRFVEWQIQQAAQQNAHLTGLTWRCDACYRVNDKANKVCWFCETAPQVA